MQSVEKNDSREKCGRFLICLQFQYLSFFIRTWSQFEYLEQHHWYKFMQKLRAIIPHQHDIRTSWGLFIHLVTVLRVIFLGVSQSRLSGTSTDSNTSSGFKCLNLDTTSTDTLNVVSQDVMLHDSTGTPENRHVTFEYHCSQTCAIRLSYYSNHKTLSDQR